MSPCPRAPYVILCRLHQDAGHPGGVGGFLPARAVFDDHAIGRLQAETVRRGEEEVGVRLRTRGVLGRDDSVEEVRDVDALEGRVHVVAAAGGGDGGLVAESADVVDDGDDFRAGGDVLGEVLLEELMTVGEQQVDVEVEAVFGLEALQVSTADMPPIEQKRGQGKSNGRPSCLLTMWVQLRWWIHMEAASVPSQSKIQPGRERRAGSKGIIWDMAISACRGSRRRGSRRGRRPSGPCDA